MLHFVFRSSCSTSPPTNQPINNLQTTNHLHHYTHFVLSPVYILNITHDGERCEQMYEKANRLIQKTKPYETHKDKQIKAFKEAVFELPYYDYVEDDEVLEKVDSVDVNYVFSHLVGTPDNKVTLSEDEIEELAKVVIKNYFIDNPTPTVKAHKYQKADDFWYISLSNGTHYQLRAIKCDNGEYEYSYTPV